MTRSLILSTFLMLAGCHGGLKQPYSIEPSLNNSLALRNPADQLWHNKLKAYPNQIVNLSDSLVLIGDSRGGLTTLNINTGDRTDRYWRPLKHPVQFYGHGDSVLYFSAETDKEIIAWDIHKTVQVWEKKFDVDYHEMIFIDSLLYFLSDSSVAKISATLGDVFQTIHLEAKLARGTARARDKIYICTESGELLEFDQQLNNTDKMDLNISMVEAMWQFGERALVYNSRGSIRIVALEKAEIEFSKDLNVALYAAPRLANDLLIIPFATGKVSAYSLKEARQKWSFAAGSLLNLDVLITNETIIFAYARGQVVCLDAETGTELWSYDHGESINFAALTHNGVLLGHRKEITFIGEKHAN
ncbi:PQQ-binding-like beta-propeller repeat protein [candidate division KSB1 bacterium]|nr:PQQ-binding-like beta-propeller repeat protein [candidate division KSB1 bacterium]